MSSAEERAHALQAGGLRLAELRRVDGQPFTFAIYVDVGVDVGRHGGTRLEQLAVPFPDDPMLPPPGLHTRPHLDMIGKNAVHPSPLGPDWAYWSRPIPNYSPAASTPRILSHIQTVFRDA